MMCWDIGSTVLKRTKGATMFNQDIVDLSYGIAKIIQNVPYMYESDEMGTFHILDEVQAKLTKIRELLNEPKTDKVDDLDNSPFLHNSTLVHPNTTFTKNPLTWNEETQSWQK
jgi:hypothetical protein